jgi:hypothetical protein
MATTAIAAAVVFSSSAAASAGGAATAGCAPHGTRLAVADSEAEVYIAREPYYSAEGSHARLGTLVSYRGCAYGSRRSFRLGIVGVGSARGGVSTEKITLSGRFVAYATTSVVLESEAEFRVVVRNLHTGRTLAEVPTGVPLQSRPHYVGIGPVRTVVLNSHGAAAWIATDEVRSESVTRETGHEVEYYDLYALDPTGERLVASGIDLAPHSLALASGILYWMQGLKPFATTLR